MGGAIRILHVGHGCRPWRPGGLVTYAEELMEAQTKAGCEVAYFFSGRHYPVASKPRLRRWDRGGVSMYELLNSRVVFGEDAGTRTPVRELDEPFAERYLRQAIAEFQPDVISFLDLAGLPFSLIDIAREGRHPVLMTAHDYLPLCPTVKLYDADGRNCVRDRVGE